jgi:hypothetical protein
MQKSEYEQSGSSHDPEMLQLITLMLTLGFQFLTSYLSCNLWTKELMSHLPNALLLRKLTPNVQWQFIVLAQSKHKLQHISEMWYIFKMMSVNNGLITRNTIQ